MDAAAVVSEGTGEEAAKVEVAVLLRVLESLEVVAEEVAVLPELVMSVVFVRVEEILATSAVLVWLINSTIESKLLPQLY